MRIHSSSWGTTAVRLTAIVLSACCEFALAHGAESGPKIWLDKARPLAAHFVGVPTAVKPLETSNVQPLSMAHGDFDADGINDLALGYATATGGVVVIRRGNLDAFAPQSQASFEAIGRGDFPDPFLPEAKAIGIPTRPDFMVLGSYNGGGYPDLIVAARGDDAIYLLTNDGKGNFLSPQAIKVGGPVTALAAGNFGRATTFTKLLVGISDERGSFISVYDGALNTLGNEIVRQPLPAAATSIQFGNFGESDSDAAILAGGKIHILRSSNAQLVDVSLPDVNVQAFALGRFIFDRSAGQQLAVVDADGSVAIAARSEFDPRVYSAREFAAIVHANRSHQPAPSFVPPLTFPLNGWRVIEKFPGVTAATKGQAPTILRTRISVNGGDDVMVLNQSGSLVLIAHPDAAPGSPTFRPGQVSVRSGDGAPVAALPMRLNVDGRLGVIALHRDQAAPTLLMPIPDPTFFVNTDNDPTPTSPIANACTNTSFTDTSHSCSLREAVLKANGDTIMLQAGHTYSLTIGRGSSQDYSGNTGALYVNHSATIVGGNQNTTIIQWGTPSCSGSPCTVDMVMAVNEDFTPTNATASISNLTIQNGVNHGTHAVDDADGGCMEFDTGGSGASNLSLTNITVQNCATTQGAGAGIVTFGSINPFGGGTVHISNSLFTNNTAFSSVSGTEGGGLAISAGSILTMTNTLVTNNSNTHVVLTQAGFGGGIALDASGGTQGALGSTTIHNSTISNNIAGGDGGGIADAAMNLTVDQGTVISGNSAGSSNQLNVMTGGGVYLSLDAFNCPSACTFPNVVNFNKVTITNNQAVGINGSQVGSGGGIFTGSGGSFPTAGPMSISFSRLTGNIAGAPGNTTSSNFTNSGTTVTATDNWWGTNSPASTITTIPFASGNGSGTTTFDPFIVLSNTASPNVIRIGDPSTVTGSFLQDNHGTAISASNLNVLIGLPGVLPATIFPDTPVHGTLSNVQNAIQANGKATETFTASSGGIETIHAAIDAASVPTTITILFPPSIGKTFAATHIPVAGTTKLTFTITNPNATLGLNGLAFSDQLPAGLNISGTPNTSTTCGGSVTTNTSTRTIGFSSGTIGVNTTCTVSADVVGVTDGLQNNISGNVTATDAGGLTGNTASASITVINPPTIAKSFAPNSIAFGATSTLMITVSNTNTVETLNGIAFTDNLPTGITVASPSNLTTTCNGTESTPNTSTVSLSGALLAPGTSCQVSLTVQGSSAGLANNSVSVSSTDFGVLSGNTASAGLTVTPATTSTAVASSSNPSIFGQSVTFTATVSNTSVGSAGAPTGSVQFIVDGTNLGTPVALTGASSTSSTATSPATATLSVSGSSHTVTATYTNADGNYSNSSGSLVGGQVVNQASTSTGVASSSNPSVFGQSVTFTVTVSDTSAGSTAAPTGAVQFVVDGTNFGSPVPLAGATSTSSTATSQATTTLSVAGSSHTVSANYVNADGNYSNSTGALAGGQTVNKADTSMTVVSSQNPQTAGQPVMFTATVSAVPPGFGTLTGFVEFLDAGNAISDCAGTSGEPLSSGQATCTTSSLSPGSHNITARYLGDGNFNTSNGSLTSNQVITQATTTTTVIASQGTIALGDTVTFTATVTTSSGTAAGIVTVFDGNTPIGNGILNGVAGNDTATFTTSLLSTGTHSITATYQGATAFVASTSSSAVETVSPRATTTGLGLNPTAVVVGQSSTATITLTDAGSVPSGTADTFAPTGAPATGRTRFTSTLFADGLVLVAGGTDANNIVLNSAQIYSVSNGTFGVTGNLNTARTGATAMLLPNGKVLIAGGSSNGAANDALNTAELFDPSAGTFAPTSHVMNAARSGAAMMLLNTGKVLLAGGANSGGVLNSAELYDPTTDTFAATGNLNSSRTNASAILLGTGKVLVAGGSSDGTANGALNSAELFDPAGNAGAGTFTSVAGASPALSTGRWQPEVALLPSGRVLIAGGQNSGGALTSADLYDPAADSFAASSQSMAQARANGTAVALPSGMVLLAGGTTSQAVDLYDPDSDRFDTTGSLQQSDVGLDSVLLNNGQVLVVGLTTSATPASDTELYSPSFNPVGTVAVTSSEATDGITGVCTLVPSNSTASTCTSTVTPANVATNPHTITGTYPADAVHSGSNNTASLTVGQANTTTMVASTQNPSLPGQSVTFTATVSPVAPGAGTPTGTVQFSDNSSPLSCNQAGTLSGGTAQCTPSSPLTVGTHPISAQYSGDSNFIASTGQLPNQVVNKATSTTTINSLTPPSPITVGSSTSVSVTVSGTAPGGATPTGTVTVSDGGSGAGDSCTITPITLSAASCTLTPSSAGNQSVTATYSGDGTFLSSMSSVPVSVTPPTRTITATTGPNGSIAPPTQYVVDGNTASFTVTPNSGYSAMIGGTCPPGTLSNNTYTTGPITGDCTVMATFVSATASLTLLVTDSDAYARYGTLINYVVTVSNAGGADVGGLSINGGTSPDLDTANGHWICFGSASDCAPSGTGAFTDSVTIPAKGSVSWIVTEPLLENAPDSTVSYTVSLNGPSFASPITQTDTDTLVLFRDGFDVPYGNGTQAPTPMSTTASSEWDGSSALIVYVAQGSAALVEPLLRATAADHSGFRVERLSFDSMIYVRLVAIGVDGSERAGEWLGTGITGQLVLRLTNDQGTLIWLETSSGDSSLQLGAAAHAAYRIQTVTTTNH